MKTSDENTTPFNRLLGTRCLFKKEGKSRYELSLGPDHLNRRGVAHGGVVASLLDTAMTRAPCRRAIWMAAEPTPLPAPNVKSGPIRFYGARCALWLTAGGRCSSKLLISSCSA